MQFFYLIQKYFSSNTHRVTVNKKFPVQTEKNGERESERRRVRHQYYAQEKSKRFTLEVLTYLSAFQLSTQRKRQNKRMGHQNHERKVLLIVPSTVSSAPKISVTSLLIFLQGLLSHLCVCFPYNFYCTLSLAH